MPPTRPSARATSSSRSWPNATTAGSATRSRCRSRRTTRRARSRPRGPAGPSRRGRAGRGPGRGAWGGRGAPGTPGGVGGGAGVVCRGWKGGMGPASRVVPDAGATVGVLVLANFGAWSDLRIDGVAVGRALGRPDDTRPYPAGSCIVVVATDAPLGAAQLQRVARRAGLGLARTGSVAHHASG